jgi:hypothetical protein
LTTFAATTSSTHGNSTFSTSRYSNGSADFAWFWVDADTSGETLIHSVRGEPVEPWTE